MRSVLPGVAWPAIVEPSTAQLFALAWQLEQTQWWSAAKLRQHQELQLRMLLAHALTVPHYEATLFGIGFADFAKGWARVPILTRDQVIAAGDRLLSRKYPAPHGNTGDILTSRTSGTPVRVRGTEVTTLFWRAITLRDHAWHRRDLDAKLATIRFTGDDAGPPDGARSKGWGASTVTLAPEAPLARLSVVSTTEQQIAWLSREDPAYLIVYPTVLEAILRRGITLPSLREVRTVSEALPDGLRALCRDVLGVPLVDMYSAQEVGYLALQCPTGAHYHVQSESVLVEILRDDGAPCAPGETGRVIVTDLHNFATPLIRYELGDYAEVGTCACGRGLPTLTRIVGRRRGMLRYADGRTTWPVFTIACREAARYRECQLVQDSISSLRLRVVPDGALVPGAEAVLIAALQRVLGPFDVTVEVVAQLDRSPAGKLEEFVSRV